MGSLDCWKYTGCLINKFCFYFVPRPVNQYEQQNNVDFFGNDFGSYNNSGNSNNNNVDLFGSVNNDNGYLQQQPTGFNNPYLQFQQQQLQQQQLQQQQLMQQQMMQQQQLQQQQQHMFMNSMNNPYQQQLMPQMTGAPNIGSNNPFSAFAQKPAMTGQPFNSFQNGQNNTNLNTNTNLNPSSSNNNNPLGDLAFLQNSMTTGAPVTSQAQVRVYLALQFLKSMYRVPNYFFFFFFLLVCRESEPERREICTLGYGSVKSR